MQNESPSLQPRPPGTLQPGTLCVSLLGGLRVTCDDRTVADADWRLSKARSIVKLLALTPDHQLHREYLIDLFWPDLSPSAADNNFHQALLAARRALATPLPDRPADPLLRLRQGVLTFNPDQPIWIDVDAFTAGCRSASNSDNPADYFAAVDLYRGELLPEDRYEEWVIGQREALQQHFLDLLLRLGRLYERRNERAPAIDVFRRIVALDPILEDAHRGLIRLYAQTGRRQQALRQYERLQDLLAEELDTEPSVEVRRLYLDILEERFPEKIAEEPKPPPPAPPAPRQPAPATRRTTFVNRDHERQRLLTFLERSIAGTGHVVTIGGELGIGKTWLIEEVVEHARQMGIAAHWGRCYEGSVAPAYWPWTQIVRSWIRDRDPSEIEQTMRTGAREIMRIVPEIEQLLPNITPSAHVGADEERFRLFSAISEFLRKAAERAPLALVIDDLHWADRSSLLMLEFLLDEISTTPICIIGAYRDIEIDQRHPLTRILAKLSRSEDDWRISLKGLGAGDVARIAELASGHAPSAALAHAIHEQTEGNPFFVREIVRLLVDEDRYDQDDQSQSRSFSVPQGVRETIGLRLDRLSNEALRLLTVAAVAGREFELPVVAHAGEVSSLQALDLIDEGLAAAVLDERELEPNQFRFSHALIRQTLYDEASRSRRVHLHRRIGEAIELIHATNLTPWLDDLAAHFTVAAVDGSIDKALQYSIEAGRLAMSRIAYGEAVEYLRRAAELLGSRGADGTARHIELLLQLAEALRSDGQTVNARATLIQAAGLATILGEHELLARAALGMAAIEEEVSIDDDTAVQILDQALELLPPEASTLRAALLASLSKVLQAHDPDSLIRRQQLSQQAVEIARTIGDPATLANALYARLMATWEPLDLRPSLGETEEILQLAQEAGDVQLTLIMHSWRFSDLLSLADVAGADRELAAYQELAEQLLLPYNRWSATLKLALRAQMAGRFDEANRHAAEAYEIGKHKHTAPVSARPVYAIQQFALHWERGGLEHLEADLRAIIDNNLMSARFARCLLAVLYCETDNPTAAEIEVSLVAGDGLESIPRDIFWPSVMTLLAEAALALDDRSLCQQLFQQLAPFSDQIASSGTALICIGPISSTLGRLAAADDNADLAVGYLEMAIETGIRIGAPPVVAWAQHTLANVLAASSDPRDLARVSSLRLECERIARELGMTRLLNQIEPARGTPYTPVR